MAALFPPTQRSRRYLPHISRIFAAGIVFCTFVIVVFVVNTRQKSIYHQVLGIDTLTSAVHQEKEDVGALSQSYIYWKQVVEKHPDYRDGLLMLALICQKLHKNEEAMKYQEMARLLDPNY